MKLFKTFLVLFFVFNLCNALQNRLLVISLDGFRWDYLQNENLWAFQWFIKNGISSKWLEPVFPTKTFPCHISMSTGLYVENHKMVSGAFYDINLNMKFQSRENADDPVWWKDAEPIWIAATKNNIQSGVYNWPGAEGNYGDVKPKYSQSGRSRLLIEEKIDEVIQWFLNGTSLVYLYHLQPDKLSHVYGPDSDEVKHNLRKLNFAIDHLKKQLIIHNLFKTTNIIIVSDHGFETIKKIVVLKDRDNPFDTSIMRFVSMEGSVFNFLLKPGLSIRFKNKYLADLQTFLGENFHVYNTIQDFPNRWNFKHDIYHRWKTHTVLAEPGYLLYLRPPKEIIKGDHGYDNKHENMKGIFLAYGPDFKNMPRKVNDVHQVDLFGLSLRLLNLPESISMRNGSRTRIDEIIGNCVETGN